jgi:hypothetical protein
MNELMRIVIIAENLDQMVDIVFIFFSSNVNVGGME